MLIYCNQHCDLIVTHYKSKIHTSFPLRHRGAIVRSACFLMSFVRIRKKQQQQHNPLLLGTGERPSGSEKDGIPKCSLKGVPFAGYKSKDGAV